MSNILVVGLGNMGRNHKRVLEQIHRQDVRTLDPRIDAGADYTVLSIDLVEWTDIVCIAAPIDELAGLADAWISRRKHVLVEKPGATDVATLAYLHQRAAEQEVNFAVGYTERYNPAVAALALELPKIGALRHISIQRLGYADSAVDPALNLACHDFDVLDTLGFRPQLWHSLRIDGHLAVHLADWDRGVTMSVEASHLHSRKVRKLEAVGTDGVLWLNYQRRRIDIEKVGDEGPHGGVQFLAPDGLEPLAIEWASFLDAGAGSSGTVALALAERVVASPQFATLDPDRLAA